MERIKTKILKNSEQLKEECEAVQLLLNKILAKDRNVVEEVANLSEKEMLLNKKHFLSVMEYQYQSIQKLLEIGIELDEFGKQVDVPSTGNHNGFASKTEISLVNTDVNINSKQTIQEKTHIQEDLTKLCVSIEEPVKSHIPIEEPIKLHIPIEEPVKSCIPIEESITSYKCTEKPSSNEIYNNPSASKDYDTPNIMFIEVSKNAIPICTNKEEVSNESSTESSSTSNKHDNKKSSADVSSSEDVSLNMESKKKTIQEKLKSKKLMTRRDRYLQNIQRPEIPDLSFKPSKKVFDSAESYITCPESSSSTSAAKMKEKKRKKRRSIDKEQDISLNGISYKEPPEPHINLVCLVSRIVSPSEFYINCLDEDIAVVDTISYQLDEIFKDTSSPFSDKKTAMEKLGQNCVCYLEAYKSWYRVTVMNWRLKARDYQEDLVSVYLVDYGHICNTSYKNLRELTEDFCHVPPCAIRCHLAWLYPPGSTKENLLEIWSKEALEYFYGLFSKKSDCLYKVVYVEKCGDSWGIDVVIYDDEEGSENEANTFGQLLLDKKLAVEIFQDPTTMFKNDFFLKQVKTAKGLAGISQSMENDDRLDKFHENTRDEEYNNIDQAMLRYRATDEARVCKHSRPNGTCFKGQRCKLEHGKLRSDGITTDKQCIYVSAFEQLEMPSAGTTVRLRITNVLSVDTFYACLMAQSEGLKNLISKMNQRDTVAKYKSLEIMPALGEMVIAKNWNKYWYRAQVKDIYHFPQNPEETIQVFFVDLGETVDTNMKDLKIMTSEFLFVPFQAIYCKLYNVKPKEGQDPAVAREYSESHFLCQIFDADVMYASPSTLEVVLRKENSTVDVGEQIIDDGFGELRTGHEFPSEMLLVD